MNRKPLSHIDDLAARAAQGDEAAGLAERARIECGIDPKYVFSATVMSDGEVVIVTNGGSKVRWVEGQDAPKLTPVQITGINPENARRKPITGKGK